MTPVSSARKDFPGQLVNVQVLKLLERARHVLHQDHSSTLLFAWTSQCSTTET